VGGIPFVRARIWFYVGHLPSSQVILIGRTLLLSLLFLEDVLSNEVSELLTEEEVDEEMKDISLLNCSNSNVMCTHFCHLGSLFLKYV